MGRAWLLLAALAALFAAAPARAGEIVDATVDALRDDNVYVAPGAERAISDEAADRLRERIAGSEAGPVYVAILPDRARQEAGGSADAVGSEIIRGLAREGTYALVVGDAFRAGSTELGSGEAQRLASEALREHRAEGVAATLLAFVDLVAEERTGGSGEGEGGGGGGGLATVLLPLLAVGGIGFFVFRRRRRREVNADLAEVKAAAQEDLLVLADEIRSLDLDTQMPGVSNEARGHYERALAMYEKADAALDRARDPADLEEVSAAVEEGRWAIAATRARLEGREPPKRTPPCFFDPRHGPSAREVEWAPDWGEPRLVPACEADAQRVEQGRDPAAREVMVGGRATPYWDAPPAYGPWAGGFFGGFGGLFPGILLGSMLGGAFFPPGAYGGGDGDVGGGGDFDNIDFGGGGDFGGGDFGGGGDF